MRSKNLNPDAYEDIEAHVYNDIKDYFDSLPPVEEHDDFTDFESDNEYLDEDEEVTDFESDNEYLDEDEEVTDFESDNECLDEDEECRSVTEEDVFGPPTDTESFSPPYMDYDDDESDHDKVQV